MKMKFIQNNRISNKKHHRDTINQNKLEQPMEKKH